ASTAPYFHPAREPMSRCGAWDIDSMPPATTTSASPEVIIRAASITAVRPDRHTLFTLCAGVAQPIPAPSAACRAGFWPEPAGSTCPMITASTTAGSTPPRSSAPTIAAEPSCGPEKEASAPWSRPCGVRAAATTTISDMGCLPAVTTMSAVIVPHGRTPPGALPGPASRAVGLRWGDGRSVAAGTTPGPPAAGQWAEPRPDRGAHRRDRPRLPYRRGGRPADLAALPLAPHPFARAGARRQAARRRRPTDGADRDGPRSGRRG